MNDHVKASLTVLGIVAVFVLAIVLPKDFALALAGSVGILGFLAILYVLIYGAYSDASQRRREREERAEVRDADSWEF